MKLIRCHIENFGKIHGFDYEFDGSFNEILQENGWGKTTFSVFIKSMFYGLEKTRRHNIDDNERKKYTPWQGGNFGGSLVFENQKGRFRIERFFCEPKDTFVLKNDITGKISNEYSENIGIELFGLDEASYERSTFVPQKVILEEISDEINSKLINQIQGTNKPEALKKAIDIIEKSSKKITKASNGTKTLVDGEIREISKKLDELKKEKNIIDIYQKTIDDESAEIDLLVKSKEENSKKIKKYMEIKNIAIAKRQIADSKSKIENLKNNEKECRKILGNKRPEKSEIQSIVNDENEIKLLTSKMKDTEKEITILEEKIDKNVKVTDSSKIDEYIDKYKKRNELETKINTEKNALFAENTRKIAKNYVFPAIIAIFSLIFGFALLKNQLPISLAMFAIFAVSITVFFILFSKYKRESDYSRLNDYEIKNKELGEMSKLYEELKADLDSFIVSCGGIANDDEMMFLVNLKNEIMKNDADKKLLLEKKEKLNEIDLKIEELQKMVSDFYSKFPFDSSVDNSEKSEKLIMTGFELDRIENEINSEMIKIDEIRKNNPSIDATAEIFDYDIDTLTKESEEIQQKIDYHRDTKTINQKKIDYIRDKLLEVPELEEKLDLLKNESESLSQKIKIYDLSKTYLETANDNLSSKYLQPMKDNLNFFMEKFTGKSYDNLNLSVDLKFSFENAGVTREPEYLSKGMREIVNLAIRFSMIEVLFPNEKPFIVLDDPFVNLDKEKAENAVKLIREISDNYQIIYFVCHPSRV